jgi:hypothetical protein
VVLQVADVDEGDGLEQHCLELQSNGVRFRVLAAVVIVEVLPLVPFGSISRIGIVWDVWALGG